ncbi:MAG: hypothetical protein ACOYB2_16990 [Limnohabitans sp.]
MADITFSHSYKHYSLYSGKKNSKGFYTSILQKIDLIFNDALKNFTIPTVGHIIIDNPKNFRVTQALTRIISDEAEVRGIAPPKFHYISVIERRKNDKNFHQHLAIFIDNGNYEYFKVIQLALRRLSLTSKAKLVKRKHDTRPDFIDKSTGEIRKGGSVYFHNLRKETFDAFERISYIAKVETKLSPKFSSSRLKIN